MKLPNTKPESSRIEKCRNIDFFWNKWKWRRHSASLREKKPKNLERWTQIEFKAMIQQRMRRREAMLLIFQNKRQSRIDHGRFRLIEV